MDPCVALSVDSLRKNSAGCHPGRSEGTAFRLPTEEKADSWGQLGPRNDSFELFPQPVKTVEAALSLQIIGPLLGLQTVGPPWQFLFLLIGFFVLLAAVSYVAALLARPHESTPDRCWRAGIFYVNPDDPSLFVSKRLGIGYTLNFGNPWSWVVLAFILLAAAAPFVITFTSIHNLHTIPRHRIQ